VSYSKYSVTTQYRILFKDSCYIFMFLAGSQIFGLSFAFLGILDLYFEQWELDKNISFDHFKLFFLLIGLISVILHRLLFKRQNHLYLRIFMGEQVLAAGGVTLVLVGLIIYENMCIVIGMVIYAIFTFPSFPIMMELIGKRVGKNLDLTATGNVFAMDFAITAIIFVASDFLLVENSKRERGLGFGVWGLGFGVWGLGFGVWG
jgi:hypothetical protein